MGAVEALVQANRRHKQNQVMIREAQKNNRNRRLIPFTEFVGLKREKVNLRDKAYPSKNRVGQKVFMKSWVNLIQPSIRYLRQFLLAIRTKNKT